MCWGFDEPGEFHHAAREFLAEGLAQGLRVCCIADGDTAPLWEAVRDLETQDRGAVQVRALGDRYPSGTVVDPPGQVHAYAAATHEALAAGFAGLRVAADVTSLVATAEHLDAMTRYEHLIDRYMTSRPLSALCGYNQALVGEQTLAQLSCLHPLSNNDAPFRLRASSHATASLSGELDASTIRLFTSALQHADLRPTTGELVIDALDVTYIDHRHLLALAEHARRHDATLVLLGDPPGAATLVDFLDLHDVRIEDPTRSAG